MKTGSISDKAFGRTAQEKIVLWVMMGRQGAKGEMIFGPLAHTHRCPPVPWGRRAEMPIKALAAHVKKAGRVQRHCQALAHGVPKQT